MRYGIQITSYMFKFQWGIRNKLASLRYQFLYLFLLFACCFFPLFTFAQTEQLPKEEPVRKEIESIKDNVESNATEIKKLKKFKISGYIQGQFEVGEEFASTKVGNPTGYDNKRDGKSGNFFRFGIRRGRIKFSWEDTFAQACFQMDLTEKGVTMKDVYFKVSEPLLKVASLTAGIFYRPFGDEISYSSSRRESPERTVLCQKLFPDERDLGVMVTLSGPKGSKIEGLKLDAGAFCGNGITLPDNGKMDFIGHLKYDKKWSNYTFGVGASIYFGTVRNRDTLLYTVKKDVAGVSKWLGENVEPFQKNIRQYYGFDAQFSAQTYWGITNLRGEILWGTQPSTKGDISSPKWNLWQTGASLLQYAADFNHIRKFWGAHIYFVQDIYKTPLSVVLKYAWMNPNTQLKGNEIKSKTDLSYHYFGAGLLVKCSSNLQFICFYEVPFNSTKNTIPVPEKPAEGKIHIANYQSHVKESVFTCRMQFKF